MGNPMLSMSKVSPVLYLACNAQDVDSSAEESAAAKPPPLGPAVQCLVIAWQHSDPAAAAPHEDGIVGAADYALGSGRNKCSTQR